jgi:hypothetical protein
MFFFLLWGDKMLKKVVQLTAWETEYGNLHYADSSTLSNLATLGWVQIGKPAYFEYEVLDEVEIMQSKIDRIDVTIKAVQAEYEKKLTDLQAVRSDLLSLTYKGD